MKRQLVAAVATLGLTISTIGTAQSTPPSDPILAKIYEAGMSSAEVPKLAQALLDSIGPRLVGTPGYDAAADWAVAKLTSWGISAKKVPYGKWKKWERGHTYIDLTFPRMRTLEAMMLAWSPGTNSKWVEGEAIALPDGSSPAEFDKWLKEGGVKGKFVLVAAPQLSCRPDSDLKEWSIPERLAKLGSENNALQAKWTNKIRSTGIQPNDLTRVLEEAGAAGILTNNWSKGWGVDKIFFARTKLVPTINVSCEDYGLLARLADNKQSPRIRLNSEAKDLGETDATNVIAEIRGSEKPDEYVMLSAHFDSWDGGSGATDNGTGSVNMLEAIRLIKQMYPNPKRTILIGLWGGEEQGLNGSRGFVRDRPEVVEGLQVLFNQDNGTGHVANISTEGFVEAGKYFERWLGMIPEPISGKIKLTVPGKPSGGSTDHASFVCASAPAFNLSSTSWNYGTYTWHTNRDTYDKISIENVRSNATLTAMLVYLASEEPTKMPRTKDASGGWPKCQGPMSNSSGMLR